jgi:hypothetical protein
MELGEAGSAPAAAQPPRSWSFDQDESWEAGSAAAAQPAANTGLGKPAAMDPSTAQAAVGSATGPAATDPRQVIRLVELSGTGSRPVHGGTGAALLDVPPQDAPGTSQPAPATVSHPARMMLGMASLAAQRLRGGIPADNALATGVGLLQETATGIRDFSRKVLEPATRKAAARVDRALDRAALLPGASVPVRSIAQSRARLARVVTRARSRGEATVAAGRAEAEAFVRSGVAETLGWAQANAVPQIVDGLVPHLVDEVVPRILDGALPEIRAKLLPAVIDDLAESPQVRDLMLEPGRGVVGDAAEHLRTTTASADDRVESAFRRLVKGGGARETMTDHDGRTIEDSTTPATEEG